MDDMRISTGIIQPSAVDGIHERSRREDNPEPKKKKKKSGEKPPLISGADEVLVAGIDNPDTTSTRPRPEDGGDQDPHIDIKV